MPQTWRGPTALAAVIAATWLPVATALDLTYCATNNTATMENFLSNLQTNGLCHDHCFDDYAFSITQKFNCWCSNYAPDDSIQVDLSECNTPCPAYPDEDCGGPGLFGYLALNKVAPSGTKGAAKPSSTSPPKSSKTSNKASETSSDPSSSSKKPKPEQTTSSTSESSTTESDPSSTAVKTVTADGTVKTVFVSPSDTAGDTKGQDGEKVSGGGGGDGGGLSKGALAGVIVGVAVAVIGIAAALIWFFLRRRKARKEEDGYQEDPSIRGSSSGMMGVGGRQEMSMGGGSPGSPNTNSNRNSALMIDPRMDPFKQGLYVRNGSHESINTLRDDHDYSRRIQAPRTLRAMNPDPETHD